MQTQDLSQIEQRVKRYWYEDGIAELAGGGMFILLGLYFAIQGIFGEISLVSVILQVSLALLMIAGAFGVRWLVNLLKTRLTYPRTGYVQYRVNERDTKHRRYTIAGSAMLIAVASVVLADYIRAFDSMVLVTGLLVGLILIVLRGKSAGLKRFYVLGVLAVLLGAVLSMSGLTQAYNLTLFYGLSGITFIVSGGLTLRRYLHEHPLQPEAGSE
jgi:predicted tellurium resistance membrane protein TerC